MDLRFPAQPTGSAESDCMKVRYRLLEIFEFDAAPGGWRRASKRLAPHPSPLPARALMWRATSWDMRGEGVRRRRASRVPARCVHALGLETAFLGSSASFC
jgi:hypothetical protein